MWRSLVLWLSVVGGVWGQASYTLPFRPLDAEYSVPLNRIVVVGSAPNQLHIYDPATRIDVPVDLPAAPIDLALSPDGARAAIAHDGSITVIDVFLGTVVRTYPVSGRVRAVVLGPVYLYAETVQGYQTSILTIGIGNGNIVQTITTDYSLINALIHPNGDALYATGRFSNYLQRVKLTGGLINVDPSEVPLLALDSCGQNWLSRDGSTVFNGCGSAFWASTEPRLDSKFRGAIADMAFVRAFAEIVGRNEFAAIGYPGPSSSDFTDSEVRLYSAGSYRLAGRFTLGGVTVNSEFRPNQGKWVFSNGGSELYVIQQADPLAGLAQDFSLRVFSLAAQTPCSPTLNTTSNNVGSEGGIFAVNVTGAADCLYTVHSSANWIVGLEERLRTGQRQVRYMIRPNSGGARNGTLSVGGQALSVSQSAVAAPSNLLPLSFRLIDAAYSKSRDRMILLGSDPPELHILDPLMNSDQVVPLRQAGLSVSVDGTGQLAAVGHAGWVTLVNLMTAQVTHEYPVIAQAVSTAWGDNGYLYIVGKGPWRGLFSMRVADGEWTAASDAFPNSIPWSRKQPGTPVLYVGSERYSIANGLLGGNVTGAGSSIICGDRYWFFENGRSLLGSCGTLYRTPAVLEELLSTAGQLDGATRPLLGASHSELRKSVAVVGSTTSFLESTPADEVRIYGEERLGPSGQRALPPGRRGRYVFWNQASTAVFAIGSEGSGALADSAAEIYTLVANENVAGCSGTFTSPSGTVSFGEGTGNATVTIGSTCAWTATSSAPWLRLQSGGFGLGPLQLTFAVEANRFAVPRGATITLNGGATFTVTQSAAPIAVEPVSLTIPASGASRSVAVTTAVPTTGWTATANVPWITITGGASGTGAGTVNYTVAPNPGGQRSGLIQVNSVNVSVLQSAFQTGPGGNQAPVFVSSSLLSDGRREFVFRDPDGANDLGVLNVLINRALDGRAACYLAYNASTEQFFLVDDSGNGLLTLALGGLTNGVSNSQCTVLANGFSATKAGDTLIMRVFILFRPAFTGDQAIYAAARDLALANSGWQIAGVVRPAQATTPLNASLYEPQSPSLPIGPTVFLRLDYQSSDATLQSEFTTSQILINNALNGANACYMGFDRAANLVYLLSDDGTQLLLPGVPLGRDFTSSAIIVSNSQCELSSFGSRADAFGPTSLRLTLSVRFRSQFSGTKLIYGGLQAGAGSNSGWKILQAVKLE